LDDHLPNEDSRSTTSPLHSWTPEAASFRRRTLL
jgi:hypothetical protein